MKKVLLLMAMVALVAGMVGAAQMYNTEKSINRTMTAAMLGNCRDSLIFGPYYLDPEVPQWRRMLSLQDLDSTWGGDSVYVLTFTAPYKYLTNRVTTPNNIGWFLLDSTKVVYADSRDLVDTIIFQSHLKVDSLVTQAWQQAVYLRVIIRNGFSTGTAEADTATVGETYGLDASYFLIPTPLTDTY